MGPRPEGGSTHDIIGDGTVYRVTPGGGVTLLYAFMNGTDGAVPSSALVRGSDGNFYGTTSTGGVLFQVTPAGVLTPLHSFSGSVEGFNASLTVSANGILYGTTTTAGPNNGYGTIFQATLAGAVTVLHDFDDTDGFTADGLVVGTDGNLYGTTENGGNGEAGTFFQFNPASTTLTTRHLFNSGGSNSPGPVARIVRRQFLRHDQPGRDDGGRDHLRRHPHGARSEHCTVSTPAPRVRFRPAAWCRMHWGTSS